MEGRNRHGMDCRITSGNDDREREAPSPKAASLTLTAFDAPSRGGLIRRPSAPVPEPVGDGESRSGCLKKVTAATERLSGPFLPARPEASYNLGEDFSWNC